MTIEKCVLETKRNNNNLNEWLFNFHLEHGADASKTTKISRKSFKTILSEKIWVMLTYI